MSSTTQTGTPGGSMGSGKGMGWLKIAGIVAVVGILVAVGRIVLRVFREKPAPETEEHHEGA